MALNNQTIDLLTFYIYIYIYIKQNLALNNQKCLAGVLWYIKYHKTPAKHFFLSPLYIKFWYFVTHINVLMAENPICVQYFLLAFQD